MGIAVFNVMLPQDNYKRKSYSSWDWLIKLDICNLRIWCFYVCRFFFVHGNKDYSEIREIEKEGKKVRNCVWETVKYTLAWIELDEPKVSKFLKPSRCLPFMVFLPTPATKHTQTIFFLPVYQGSQCYLNKIKEKTILPAFGSCRCPEFGADGMRGWITKCWPILLQIHHPYRCPVKLGWTWFHLAWSRGCGRSQNKQRSDSLFPNLRQVRHGCGDHPNMSKWKTALWRRGKNASEKNHCSCGVGFKRKRVPEKWRGAF